MLRLIAILSMTADHAAHLLIYCGIMRTLPAGSESMMMWNAVYTGLRTIGRMAFPIFALLLVQGYERTRNFRNYALRIFALALVSEIPFDWVILGRWGMDLTYQNTVYTLLISLLTLKAADMANLYLQGRARSRGKAAAAAQGLPTASYFAVWLLVSAAGCLAAYLIGSDYGWEGVALVVLLYLCRRDKTQQCIVGAVWASIAIMGMVFPYVLGYIAVFVLIWIFRDRPPFFPELRKKGGIALRLAEYLYYPAHLLVLWGIYLICFLK